jgi:hypothetical protein
MNVTYKLSIVVVIMTYSSHAQNEQDIEARNTIQSSQTIKIGMTREEVVKILGPAKWVILPEDKDNNGRPMLPPGRTLKLVWDTPGYVPIQILFEGNYTVWGVGGGIRFFSLQDTEAQKEANPNDEFLAIDGQRKLLAHPTAEKNQAEQNGAGQPATRPESKSEGGAKPQPESEGRSR